MNILNKMIVALLLLGCFCGCATIFNGRTQRLAINSNVPGAVVKIDGQIVGQTPFQGDMPRSKKNRTITVETRGYDAQSQSMTARIDGVKSIGTTILGSASLGTGAVFLSTSEYEEERYHYQGNGQYYYYTETHTDDELFISGWIMIGAGVLSLTSTVVDRVNGSAYQYSPTSFYFHFADEYGSNTNEILIRKYAMLNHSQIALDAGEESGEYLNALADLMSVKMPREEAVESIKVALDYSEGDQLAFGDAIVDSFRYHH